MSAKKRLFFALWPDEKVRKALEKNTRTAVEDTAGRAVIADNLHLTLAFLHNVDIDLIPAIAGAATRACTGAFDLTIDQLGYWQRAKILFAAPSVYPNTLNLLVTNIWSELKVCGFTPERRPFRPHITLARRAVRPADRVLRAPVVWPVQQYSLIESITSQRRSTYQVLASWPLT